MGNWSDYYFCSSGAISPIFSSNKNCRDTVLLVVESKWTPTVQEIKLHISHVTGFKVKVVAKSMLSSFDFFQSKLLCVIATTRDLIEPYLTKIVNNDLTLISASVRTSVTSIRGIRKEFLIVDKKSVMSEDSPSLILADGIISCIFGAYSSGFLGSSQCAGNLKSLTSFSSGSLISYSTAK